MKAPSLLQDVHIHGKGLRSTKSMQHVEASAERWQIVLHIKVVSS